MLKLSPRPDKTPLPDWARRPELTREDLRLHWAARQAFASEAGESTERERPTDSITRMRLTPRRQRAEALVLTLARYRCACCGSPANAVRERRGAPVGACDVHDLEPVCPRCESIAAGKPSPDPDGGPMAGAVADVMSRFRPVASTG